MASIACDPSGLARVASPDWKFYGGVSSPNGESWCFYDAGSVARGSEGNLQVTAKCLPRADMDSINVASDFDGEIARQAARKRRDHYKPPYALAETMDANQTADVVRSEAIADIADIEPRVKISFELDCTQSHVRELSFYVQVNGKVRSVTRPSEWKDISPEANSVRLFRILCRRRLKEAPPTAFPPEPR